MSGRTCQSITNPGPQGTPLPGREHLMTQNHDGSAVFRVDPWVALERYLILGCEGGSYYATEREMTAECGFIIRECLRENPTRFADLLRDTVCTVPSRAYKMNPAIQALAVAAADKDPAFRRIAHALLPEICRIPTHLFSFVERVRRLRGFGRSLRRAIADWYNRREAANLEYHALKYRSRGGFSHADALRLCHARPRTAMHDLLYREITGRRPESEPVPDSLPRFAAIAELHRNMEDDLPLAIDLIRRHQLTREMLPSELLRHKAVWEALLETMPFTAMLRNLGIMACRGVLEPGSESARTVVMRLNDRERLHRSRIHPFAVLIALSTYRSGKGSRGSLTWETTPEIVWALDEAFHAAFANVAPTGKRILVGLDVSASMTCVEMFGTEITPRSASAAMCLTHLAVDPATTRVMAFSDAFVPLALRPGMSIHEACKMINRLPFGGTDCSLPIRYAIENRLDVDAFVIYTDDETNDEESEQPCILLRKYREITGIPAKLVVVGMVSNGFSIADPTDAGTLDVVGFDGAASGLITDFIRGGRNPSTPGATELDGDQTSFENGW